MRPEPDIVKQLREEETKGTLAETSQVHTPTPCSDETTYNNVSTTVIKALDKITDTNQIPEETNNVPIQEPIKDLLEIIRFIEQLSVKIHGIQQKLEIYRCILDEFKKSTKYGASILLLNHDTTKLRVFGTSEDNEILSALEQETGLQLRGLTFQLTKSPTYAEVVNEGQTIHIKAGELVKEFLPQSLSTLAVKSFETKNINVIVTPLKCQNIIIGALAINSPGLHQYFIPTVQNLANHISCALTKAEEHTKMKNTEQTLRALEERFSKAFHFSPDAISISRLADGTIIDINESWVNLFGYTRDEVIGRNPESLNLFKDLSSKKQPFHYLQKKGVIRNNEIKIILKSGQERIVTFSTELIEIAGDPCLLTIIHDITHQKNNEIALHQSQERYKAIFESAADGIIVLDATGLIKDINTVAQRMLGTIIDEIIEKNITILKNILPNQAYSIFIHNFQKAKQGIPIHPFELELINNKEEKIVVEINSVELLQEGKQQGFLAIIRNITEQKNIEKQLQKSREMWRTLIENTPEWITAVDCNGTILYTNKNSKKKASQEIIGSSIYDRFPPSEHKKIKEVLQAVFKSEKQTILETQIQQPDGTIAWYKNNIGPIKRGQTIHAAIVVSTDISQQKQTETTLLESEKKYRQFVETGLEGIWALDSQFKTTFVNKKMAEMLGYTPPEIHGKKFSDFLYSDDKAADKQHMQKRKKGTSECYECRFQRKDTTICYTIVSATALKNAKNQFTGSFAIITDISKQKQAEQTIKESFSQIKKQQQTIAEIAQSPHLLHGDIDKLAPQITESIAQTLQVNKAHLLFPPIKGSSVRCIDQFDLQTKKHTQESHLNTHHYTQIIKTLKSEPYLAVNNAVLDPWTKSLVHDYPQRHDIKSLFIAKIQLLGKQYGLLCIEHSKQHQWTDEEKNFITHIANQITTAINNKHRRTTEEILQKNEQKYRSIIEQSSAAILTLDSQGKINYTNNTLCLLLGYSRKEIIGKKFSQILHPDDKQQIIQSIFSKEHQKIKKHPITFRILHKQGHSIHFLTSSPFNIRETNTPLEYHMVLQDITALHQKETQYQNLIEHAPEIIFILDNKGVILDVNKGVKQYGFTQPSMIGKNILHYVPKKYWTILKKEKQKIKNKETWSGELTIPIQSTLFTFEYHGQPIIYDNKLQATALFIRDITKQKQLHQDIQTSQQRYHLLYEHAPYPFFIYDQHGTFLEGNKAAESLFGFSLKTLVGKNLLHHNLFPKTEQAKIKTILRKNKQGMHTGPDQLRIHRKDGSTIHIDFSSYPLQIQQNSIILGQAHDISDRITLYQQLTQSEEKFNLINENTPVAVYSHLPDEHETTFFISKNIKTITGFKDKDFIQNPHLRQTIVYQKDKNRVIDQKKKHQKNKTIIDIEYRIQTKNKQIKWIHEKATPILDRNNKIIRINGFIEDITKSKQIEQNLKQSEQRYKEFYTNLQDVVAATTLQGKIIECNQQFLDILAYSSEEVSKLTNNDITPKKWHDLESKILRNQVHKRGFSDLYEKEYIRKDGTCFPVELRTYLIKDTHGKKIGYWTAARDISQRKQLETNLQENEKRIRTITSTIPTYIYELDSKGIIHYANKKPPEFTNETIIGTTIFSWFKKDQIPTIKSILHDVFTKSKHCTIEYSIKNTKGRSRTYHAEFSPFMVNKKNTSIILTATDITERKRNEQELKKSHDDLQILNQQLEQRIQKRTQELEHILKQKDQFINQLGHDLKNPLTPIITLLPILKNQSTNPKYQELLTVVISNATSMKNLIVKTLELARLNSPNTKFDFQYINIHEIVNDILHVQQPIITQRHILIKNNISKNITIYGDKLRLGEVFTTLLSNALRFTPPGGTISLNAVKNTETVRISIRDTGVGMTTDQKNKVFTEFSKTDSSPSNIQHSGLGLIISKHIIEKHGGKIWVESQGIGKGSTFHFTLVCKPHILRTNNHET